MNYKKIFDEADKICAPYAEKFIKKYGDSRFDARRHTLNEPIVIDGYMVPDCIRFQNSGYVFTYWVIGVGVVPIAKWKIYLK
jgi:hypothetical protein